MKEQFDYLSLNYDALDASTYKIAIVEFKRLLGHLRPMHLLVVVLFIFLPVLTFAVLGILFFGYILYRSSQIKKINFAKDNGFQYTHIPEDNLLSGSILSREASEPTDILTITHGTKYSYHVFDYIFSGKIGRKKEAAHFLIAKYELKKKIPHFILDDRDSAYSAIRLLDRNPDLPDKGFSHIELEGDFDNHYKLYVEEGKKTHIDVLAVVTPDFMYWLTELKADFDIEVVDNDLFIYSKYRKFDNRGDLQELFRVANMIADRLEKAIG